MAILELEAYVDWIAINMKTKTFYKSDPIIVRGSVLAIPLEGDDWALGSVISPGTNFYIGFSIERFREPLNADDIIGKDLKIFSWTNDAEVFRGNWKNLGISAPREDIDLPEYRVFVDGVEMIESFDGEYLRRPNVATDSRLTFRKVRSPLLVQDAVQAVFGLGDWKPGFQDMLL